MANEQEYYSDDYEYDYEESHSTFNWWELVPVLVVYGITFILGIIGNCLIVYTTYKHSRMQNVTNVFLSSLATADLLLIIFCVPVKVAKLFSYTWAMGLFICKSVHYVQSVSIICSVFTLTAISIERYYAIIHPMRAKYICTISQARRVILFTWCLAIVLACPTLYIQVQKQVGSRRKAYYCDRDWDDHIWWRCHELYMLILIFLIPFCIMTLSYSFICWEVWNVMERRSIMTCQQSLSRQRNTKQKDPELIQLNDINGSNKKSTGTGREDMRMVKQVIYMLVAVIVLFAFCWVPLLTDNVLKAFKILPNVRTGPLRNMGTTFHLMAYFNSCINPVIYGFMSKNFRESVQSVLCCGGDGSDDRHRIRMSSIRQFSRTGSQTRSTSVK